MTPQLRQDIDLATLYLNAPMPNLNWARRMALRAQAYYDMVPYPVFGFQEWKTEDRGPIPKCLPFCSNIVRRSAKWLFGKPPRITCTNKGVEDKLLTPFKRLYPKLKQAAVTSMNEGSITLRYAFNSDKKEGTFSFLSTLEHVRFVYDQHDADKVLIAYVQYPIYDPVSAKWVMYREAWTEKSFIVYDSEPIVFMPVKFGENSLYGNVAFIASGDSGAYQSAELFSGWKVNTSKCGVNPLNFIPLIQIRNEENETVYGEGITWRVTHIIDRINLAYHLMDKSNQFDSDPMLILIDADLAQNDISTTAPGGVQALNTRETADGGNRQAKAHLLEPSGRLRPYMKDYVDDLRGQVSDLTGTVEVSSKEVSNKGNFTQSVLNQIYAPLIESTDARRVVWESKFEEFLEKCAVATSSILSTKWKDSDKFNLEWPNYFILPEQEKGLKLDRLVRQEGYGLVTKDRVIQELAAMDEIEDVDEFIKELESYEPKFEEYLKSSKDNVGTGDAPAEAELSSKKKSKEDTVIS